MSPALERARRVAQGGPSGPGHLIWAQAISRRQAKAAPGERCAPRRGGVRHRSAPRRLPARSALRRRPQHPPLQSHLPCAQPQFGRRQWQGQRGRHRRHGPDGLRGQRLHQAGEQLRRLCRQDRRKGPRDAGPLELSAVAGDTWYAVVDGPTSVGGSFSPEVVGP